MKEEDLGLAIIKGACNPEAKDLVVDLSEIAIYSVLEDGVLKEIPVLKSVIAAHKTWETIRDRIFLRKVFGFIRAGPKLTEEERQKFAKENLDDLKKARRLCDTIVLIIDRLDDMEKSPMFSNVFGAFARGKLDFEALRRLAAAIDIGFLEDL